MSSLKHYIIDTETTGLSVAKHEVVEYSLVRCEDRCQMTRFIKAEKPENADPRALEITGKTPASLQKGLPKEQAAKELADFINQDGLTPEHRVIVAHNAPFDRRFVHALFSKVNLEFPAICWLDTQTLAKQWFKLKGFAKTSATLDNSLKVLNIPLADHAKHNAASDAKNTYMLWLKAIEAGIDYLPHIKRVPHINTPPEEYQEDIFE